MRKVILLVLVIGLLQGCATIMTGKMQTITFNSNPSGAKVIVDGKSVGITPATSDVWRKSKIITFDMDGYLNRTLNIKKSDNGWVYGDDVLILGALVTGIVCLIVDYGNGSAYSIKKYIDESGIKHKILNNTINVDLKKK